MNMALPDTLQQKATNETSLQTDVCVSVHPVFYTNMVACKSKEFRFCLPAFTVLALSLSLFRFRSASGLA